MVTVLSVLLCACLLQGSHGIDSLRFFIIGDMGGVDYEPYSTYYERCTAKEMGKMADVYSPQFILELGDNFYFEGVKSVDSPRFNKTFEWIYTAKSLQVPWYLIAGNHDHNGNVSAQIAYSQYSKRWNFPDYYYYHEYPVSDGKTVGIVFIDTVLLCGITDDRETVQPNGPKLQAVADQQWAFIEKALKTSKASYLFTAGHYPVYSVAEHGPTDCLVRQLQPMLDNYKVNGHLSGHDHNLQHLRVKSKTGDNIDYFVSGMANFVDPSLAHLHDVPSSSSLFHFAGITSKGGFLYAEATTSNITMTFIDASGNRLYTTTVFPRKL